MRRAALGFQFLRSRATLRFNGPAYFVERDQCERVAVRIFKSGKNAAPDRRLPFWEHRCGTLTAGWSLLLVLDASQARRMTKAHAALHPLAVLGGNVVGDEDHLRGTADELVFFRLRSRRDQRQYGGAVGRSYAHPALTGWNQDIKDHVEPKLVLVEAQASLQVANVNVDRLDAEVGAALLRATVGLLRQES